MNAPITPERWLRVSPLLDRLFDAPPGERRALAQELAQGDRELQAELESFMTAAGTAADAPEATLPEYFLDLLEPEHDEELAGRRVGPWVLRREIGRGGMGVVYLAERAEGAFEQRAALKLLRRGIDTDEMLDRFRRERQILARLAHPNIARLLDGGADESGRPWLAMEYVEGAPLTAWCDERRLDIDARLRLFVSVCDAVDYAHRSLVVHRDIKPINVLVTAAGEPKLLDFGIAKILGEGDEAAATRTGHRPMTPRYASPEQVRGEAVTTATDAYALGLVLYELLAGAGPYRPARDREADLEHAILEQEPEPPSRAVGRRRAPADQTTDAEEAAARRGLTRERLARRLEGDLDAIVLTALRKEPAARYPTASALAEDVRRHLDGRPVAARRPTLAYRSRRFLARHRYGAAAGLLVALSLVAGLAGTAWQARAKAREARRAAEVKKFLVSIFQASDPSQARGEVPSARELLDRGASRLQRELGGEPEVRAELLQVVGGLYRELGAYDQAEPLLAEAVALKRAVYGKDHAQVADALYEEGALLVERGQFEAAEGRLREMLAIRRRRLGAHDPLVADALVSLGVVRRRQNDLETPRVLYEEALAIQRRALGPEHEEVATTLHNMAVLSRYARRHDDSDRQFAEAAALRRKRLGPDHPRLASTLDEWSTTLRWKNDIARALPIADEALAIRRRILGPDHPDLALTLNNVALLRAEGADFDGALAALDESLAIYGRTAGVESRPFVRGLANQGSVLVKAGRYGPAEKVASELVARRRRSATGDPVALAGALVLLARARHGLGHASASGLFEEAIALVPSAAGGYEAWVASAAKGGLGRVLLDQGRAVEAEPLLRSAYDILRRQGGGWDRELLEAALALSEGLVALGRAAEARPLVQTAHATLLRTRGGAHPMTRHAAALLAQLSAAHPPSTAR